MCCLFYRFLRLVRTIQKLRQKNVHQHKIIKRLRQNLLRSKQNSSYDAASKLFNPDQVRLLQGDLKRVRKWSDRSITESFEIRFACGTKGYKFLRNKGYPFPSIRTQQAYLQNLHFDSGILTEVFDLLDKKVQCMSTPERDCGLVLDEMSIDQSFSYCCNNKKYFGDVTIPGQTGRATHGLIFMLVGVYSRWKQVVAYFFTGNSIPDGFLKSVIVDIISRAEALGLKVHFTTSDCGPNNIKMWNDFGLKHTKSDALESRALQHPVRSSDAFEILPDATHVFKSCVQGWVKNRFIYLPQQVVEENDLVTNEADILHLRDLVHFEKGKGLKMASRLTFKEVDFLNSSSLDAMKVANSYKLVNHDVAAALRFMSAETNRKELLTTAFWIETVWRWFKLMTSRQFKIALSLQNLTVYNQTVSFLRTYRTFIFECKVGIKKLWKPWQTASILCTNSILRLQHHFLYTALYTVVFTARFTQDCVENTFSLLRFKQKRPTALQFKDNLKLLSVSQFMTEIPGSSYEHDDRQWLMDFTGSIRNLNPSASSSTNMAREVEEIFEVGYSNDVFEDTVFDNSERNQIYHVGGYILRSVALNYTVCEACFSPCISEYPYLKSFTRFTILKDYTGDALIYITEPVYMFFVALERIFRDNISGLVTTNKNIPSEMTALMMLIKIDVFEDCHNIRKHIIERFVTFRLRIFEPYKTRSNKLDSRSMAV